MKSAATEHAEQCEASGLLYYPDLVNKAAQILEASHGYSKEDAQFAAQSVYKLNDSYDGEPTLPSLVVNQALELTIPQLRAYLKRAGLTE